MLQNFTIIYVDDDDDDIFILKEALCSITDMELVTLKSGDALFRYLQCPDHIPCLIIVDYNLPKMNGMQICSRLKGDEQLKNIPVVLYSTSVNVSLVSHYSHLFSAMFVKPSKLTQLQPLLKKMLSYSSSKHLT